MTGLQGDFKIISFFLSPTRNESCCFIPMGRALSLFWGLPKCHGASEICPKLIHTLLYKWGTFLIINREQHKCEQKASRYYAHLSRSSGGSWTCHQDLWGRSTSWVMDTDSFLLLHCVIYLHGGQGKSDTVASGDKKLHLQIRFYHFFFGLRFFPCSQMQMEPSPLIRGGTYA